VENFKKALDEGRLIIGRNSVMKALRKSEVSKVFLASNCPEGVEDDFKHYASLTGASLEKLDLSNEELGVACKKPFPILVLALKK